MRLESVLDAALRVADAAEVYYDEGESRSATFENNRLKRITTEAIRGVGLRVIKAGRIGFASTTDIENVPALVRNAVESAMFGQEARFKFPSTCRPNPVKLHDPAVVSLSIERAVEIGREGIDRVLARAPDVQCSGGVSKSVGVSRLMNSAGLSLQEEATGYSMGLSVLRVAGESLIWLDEGESSNRLCGDLTRHADEILRKLSLCEKELRPRAGVWPVIFLPKTVGFLLSAFTLNANGKNVQKGVSLFIGRLGERILDERVTIWHDPLVDYAPGSAQADDEGVPTQKFPIIENGILKRFIFDLQTAGIMQTESTGNGFRSFSSQPHPSYGNIILQPGKVALEDMIRNIRYGLLVDEVMGTGQSNVLAGEFSVNVALGFLVENGQIVGRVKDCMLAGNVFDAFKKIAAIGDRAEWHGSYCLPAICFEGLSISAG